MANISNPPVSLRALAFRDKVRREAISLWKEGHPETVKRFHEVSRQFFEKNVSQEAYDALVNEIETSALAEYGERAEEIVRNNLLELAAHPHGSPSPRGRG